MLHKMLEIRLFFQSNSKLLGVYVLVLQNCLKLQKDLKTYYYFQCTNVLAL